MSASDLPKTYMFVSIKKSMTYRQKHPRLKVLGPTITTILVDESVAAIGHYFSTSLNDGYQGKCVDVKASEQNYSFSPVTCTLEGLKINNHRYEYTYTIEAYNCVPFKTTYARDIPLKYWLLSTILDRPDRV